MTTAQQHAKDCKTEDKPKPLLYSHASATLKQPPEQNVYE